MRFVAALILLMTLSLSMVDKVMAGAEGLPLVLGQENSYRLGGYAGFLRDPDGQWTIKDFLFALQSKPLNTTAPGYMMLGLTEEIYWFNVNISTEDDRDWYFTARYVFNNGMKLYLLDKSQPHQAPVRLNRDDWWSARHYSQKLPLETGKHYQLLIRADVPGPDKFAYLIENDDSKKSFDIWDNRWLGLFYGGFLTLVIYNVFLAVSTRSITYGFYILYMFCMLGYLLMMDGTVLVDLSVYYAAICSIVIFGCQFCRLFLRTAKSNPVADRVIRYMMWAAALLAVAILLIGAVTIMTLLVMVLAASYGVVLASVGIISRLRGIHVARFFLLAWMFPLAGVLFSCLMYLGIAPYTDVGFSAIHISTLIEAILLSMALADRINMLRKERQRAIVEAKEKLELSNQALARANRLKDNFLGTISHELRTPMNGIIGTLELLKNAGLTTHQRECLATLDTSSTQMLTMVERILLFSELQSGSVLIQPKRMTLSDWLLRLEQQWHPMFARKEIGFTVRTGDIVAPAVLVDVQKLDYFFHETLSNAEKFTHHGHVELTLAQVQKETALTLVIEVKDTGIGIPASQLTRITESFNQVQADYNRRYGGLGIGMAIAHEIIAAMGGKLHIDSCEQQGTQIHAEIPVEAAVAATTQVDNPPQGSSREANSSLQEGSSVYAVRNVEQNTPSTPLQTTEGKACIRVLLVEDNQVNIIVMKKILESLSVSYDVATNGEEAVAKTLEEQFALILMDCQMPVMDGFAATWAIRQASNPNHLTPIVAVTANATDQDRDHCIAVGMNDYLKKPVKPRDIHNVIDRWTAANDSVKKAKMVG